MLLPSLESKIQYEAQERLAAFPIPVVGVFDE